VVCNEVQRAADVVKVESHFDFSVRLCYFAKEVTEAARILSRLAWSPWLARIDLRWRLRELRIRTAKCDAPEVRRALRNAQHTYGELPRPLGQLVTKT